MKCFIFSGFSNDLDCHLMIPTYFIVCIPSHTVSIRLLKNKVTQKLATVKHGKTTSVDWSTAWAACKKAHLFWISLRSKEAQNLYLTHSWVYGGLQDKANLNFRAQLFERRLALTRVSFFFLYKVFSRIIFSILFKVSDHQIVGKKN